MLHYLHHEDLLLDDAEVVALLQLDHFDGRELAGRYAFRLKYKSNGMSSARYFNF